MIAWVQPRNSVPRCISSARRAWPLGRVDRARLGDQAFAAHAACSAVEAEGGVEDADGKLELGFGDQRADLDLARRHGEQVDLALGEHLEHLRGELRVGADADADDADLGDRVVGDELRRSRSRPCAARSPPSPGRGSRAER